MKDQPAAAAVEPASPATPEVTRLALPDTAQPVTDRGFNKASVDTAVAERVATFLLTYLKEDLPSMAPVDRRFQFCSVDLNADGRTETFVRFLSPYFCGSGGCTLLLLDADDHLLTRFTVTEPPLFVASGEAKGWRDILVKSEGRFRLLASTDGHYPSNPSTAPVTELVPSGHDRLVFHDEMAPCRTWLY